MKMQRQLGPLLAGLVVLGLVVGVFRKGPLFGGAGSGARKVQFYQDSMHPWVKSDQPGKCTICAMDLTPILEGQGGFDVGSNLVVLSSNSITVLNVQSAEARRQPLRSTLRVSGTLEANESSKTVISAPAPCRIQAIMVDHVGMEVRKDQALVSIFSPELVQKAGYFRNVPRAQQILDLPKATADPYSRDLVAPFAGVVVERNVFQGQYVPEGEKLITLVDASVIGFRFEVNDRQSIWLEPGQRIDVSVSALPGKVFPAVIAYVEPTLNELTRTLKVRADLQNPLMADKSGGHRLLRFGTYAEGRIRAEAADVLAVPRTAVLYPGNSAFVHVEKGDGAYERRRVRVGRQGDDLWEILSGLDPGDRVVTSGNVLIDAQAQFNRTGEAEEVEAAEEMTSKEMPAGEVAAKPMDHAAMNSPEGGGDAKVMSEQEHEDKAAPAAVVSAAPGTRVPGIAGRGAIKDAGEMPAAELASAARPSAVNGAKTNGLQAVNPFALPGGGAGGTNQPLSRAQRSSARMASVDEMRRQRISMIVAAREQEREMSNAMAKGSAAAMAGGASNATSAVAMKATAIPGANTNTPGAAAAAPPKPVASHEAFSATQREALVAFTTEAAVISKALSSDDLPRFNDRLPRLPAAIEGLNREFPAPHRWQKVIERLGVAVAKAAPAKDLAEARKSFLPFSSGAVEIVRELRKQDARFASLKVYHCPMAPKPGLWIQSQGPLENPFYGAEMFKCGVEIRE